MTYLAQELSAQDGAPVLLFLFTQSVTSWRYTSAAQPVDYDGYTWGPTEISMGNVTQSNEMNKDTLSLDFPRGHEFASQFVEYSPELVTSVTVFRQHLGDVEVAVYWKGRVIGASAQESVITVECEPIFTSLRRAGLRGRYQKLCRHVLYGRGCTLDRANFETAGTVTAVDGFVLTVAAAAGLDTGYLVGGMIDYNGVLRYIMNHVGDQVTLIRPVLDLTQDVADNGSASILMHPGCAHNFTTCKDKFNNLDNFGGFPWIPGTNPFEFKSLV